LLAEEWRVNCLSSESNIEQICSLVRLELPGITVYLDAIKTEALRTLASIIFLEKPRKVQIITNSLDLGTYHGFTPTLLRKCIDILNTGTLDWNTDYSINFVTALFSFIYHIAGLEYGFVVINGFMTILF
jgi:hypothetical protein